MKKSFLTGIAMVALVVFPSQVFAADTTTLQTQLMTYLPYILIGGAAILLISIVGILLSKRKEKNAEETTPSVAPVVADTTPATFTPEVQTPVQPVNMDSISSNLYAPAESKPTIQEAMESNTPTEELPMAQPEFAPSVAPVTEQTQSSDLQDILQGEASASPMGPVTDNVQEPESSTPSFVANPMSNTPQEVPEPSMEAQLNTPVEPMISSFAPNPMPDVNATPDTTMNTQFNAPVVEQTVPTFNTSAPEVAPVMPDLQQFINNQVAEVPPMATPVMETPAPVAAPVETPMPDFNQAPTTDTTTPTQTGVPFSI